MVRQIGSLLVIGAALWFVSVQAFVLGAFCIWCCTAHALAVTGVLFSIAAHRAAEVAGSRWLPAAAMAGLALIGLIGIQIASPQRSETFVTQLMPDAVSASNDGKLAIHGGRFQIEIEDFPTSGNASADHWMVALVDYTCSHCRQLHGELEIVKKAHGDRLGIVELPAFRNPESFEIQGLMLALFREDPQAFGQLSRRLFRGELEPKIDTVLSEVRIALGERDLRTVFASHGDSIQKQLDLTKAIHQANEAEVKTANLPQLIVADEVLVGAANRDALFAKLEQKFGFDRVVVPESEPVEAAIAEVALPEGVILEPAQFEFSASANEVPTAQSMRIATTEAISVGQPSEVSPLVEVTLETLTNYYEYELVVTPKTVLSEELHLEVVLPIVRKDPGGSDLPDSLRIPLVVTPQAVSKPLFTVTGSAGSDL